MTKKKLLTILTYYYPYVSGLSRYAQLIAEDASQYLDSTILASKHLSQLPTRESIRSVDIHRFTGVRLFKTQISLSQLISSISYIKKANIIHLHLPLVESIWYAFFANLFGKKLICTFHCAIDTGHHILDKFANFIQFLTCSLADSIVVNSLDYLDGYQLLPSLRHKVIEILPPIINSPIKPEDKIEILTKIPKEKRSFYKIGYLGRMSREKGIDILLDTIPSIKRAIGNDFVILIAGPIDIPGEEKFQQRIASLITKYHNHIIHLDQINNPSALYSIADCIVTPSTNRLESFGMVQAEAILQKKPVVSSNLPGLRVPILLSSYGLLFDPKNPQSLVRSLTNIYQNRPHPPKKTNSLFDPKTTFLKYHQLYNSPRQTPAGGHKP